MSERAIRLRPAADVRPESPRWLWEQRIPLGSPSLIAGREGLGKSTLGCELTARVTRGELPGDLEGEPAHVIYASAEDAPHTTIVPRLIAAGADLDRVSLLEVELTVDGGDVTPGALTLPDDTHRLAELARESGARLLLLDPLVSYLPEQVNAHRDQHVRRVLAPLARMAADLDLALPSIVHLNKGEGSDPLARVGGSVGFTAAARSVLVFARDPDDPDGEAGPLRVIAHAKSNLGPQARSLLARIEPRTIDIDDGETIATSRVVLLGESDQTARDLLASAPSTSDERTVRDEAGEFLRVELANGPVPARQLRATAETSGFNWRTVERAKKQAGVRSVKQGTEWLWQLKTDSLSPNGNVVGLVGVVGLGKDDKDDKADKIPGLGELSSFAQDEADRIAAKWGDEGGGE